MKVRVYWKEGESVRTVAEVPHGRNVEKIGVTVAELGDRDAAVRGALAATFEEVAKVHPRASRWVSEGGSAQ